MSASPRRVIRELVETIVIALVLALTIRQFVVETILVDGQSMQATLQDGERLLINKFVYWFRKPQTGDVVVFRFPEDPRRDFIKRVIASEGQTIEIRDGQVYVDGVPLREPYVNREWHANFPKMSIAQGRLFVLGDNRNNSQDSRFPAVGQVPLKNVKGMAFLRFWPFERFNVIASPYR